MPGMPGMMEWWGVGMIFILFFWILIIAGIVFVAVFLFKWLKKAEQPESPLDILKNRYARGEIDKKEFEEKKRDLT